MEKQTNQPSVRKAKQKRLKEKKNKILFYDAVSILLCIASAQHTTKASVKQSTKSIVQTL